MPSVEVRSPSGAGAGTVDLDEAIFGIQPNVAVMHQVVTAQLAAARSGTQSTLTRAEVRGGGAKPWRQKGTGRARQGSRRAPHWSGGGVALGPKPRSYRQKTPKKMVQLALRSALSDRAGEGRVGVVDRWGFDAPRTKEARAALERLGFTGHVLVVLGPEDEAAWKSFRNLTDVHVIPAGQLNVYDVLCSDWVVFTRDTLPTAPPVAGGTAAPAHEPVPTAEGEVVNTAAPQAGLEDAAGAPEAAAPEAAAPEAAATDDGDAPDADADADADAAGEES